MKNYYKFCSICGGKLRLKKSNLHCVKCSFVNYRNPRPTATAIILYKNKILLTKRSISPFKGWWDFTGGFVDGGESPEEALAREMKEEIGLTEYTKSFFGIYTGTYPVSFDPFYTFNVIYLVEPKKGARFILDKKEISEMRWFSRKELPKKIAFDGNQKVIKDFIKIWK